MGLFAPFRKIVPRIGFLHRLCRRYVDFCNGDNQGEMEINGELRLIRRQMPQVHTVFDIGANCGDWTLQVLNINPDVHIHCFEPCQTTFETAKKRCRGTNVRCNHCAMGAYSHTQTIYAGKGNQTGSSFFMREGHLGSDAEEQEIHEESVSVCTVDDYCQEQNIASIDFVKIDVEGYELEVLKGMAGLLSQGKVRMIQFEYGGTFIDARIFLKDIWDFMKQWGTKYAFFKIFPDGLRPMPKYNQTMDNFKYQNWLIRQVS